MKKRLVIVALNLLLSGNVFAEICERKNCYYQGNDKTWNEENWLKKSSAKELLSIDPNTGKRNYSNKKYQKQKDVILSIDTNSQMIFVTTINTKKYLDQGKIVSDFYLDTKSQSIYDETIIASTYFLTKLKVDYVSCWCNGDLLFAKSLNKINFKVVSRRPFICKIFDKKYKKKITAKDWFFTMGDSLEVY